MSLVDQFLLSLDVLEHIFRLRHGDVVREHLRVVFVELKHSRQTILCFLESIESLKVLREVIKDQVLFED